MLIEEPGYALLVLLLLMMAVAFVTGHSVGWFRGKRKQASQESLKRVAEIMGSHSGNLLKPFFLKAYGDNEYEHVPALSYRVQSGVVAPGEDPWCIVQFLHKGEYFDILDPERVDPGMLDDICNRYNCFEAMKELRQDPDWDECTDTPIFLFQRSRVVLYEVPDGWKHDDEGHLMPEDWDFATGDPYTEPTGQELIDMECAVQCWDTERVGLNREELVAYGKSRDYNYPEGWRVYAVPAHGFLKQVLKLGYVRLEHERGDK